MIACGEKLPSVQLTTVTELVKIFIVIDYCLFMQQEE